MTDELDQLRGRLARAEKILQIKILADEIDRLAAKAGAAQNYPLLDQLVSLRLACTRAGGLMLLAGQDRPPGADGEFWERRAAMSEAQFAAAVARAVSAARNRFGAPPSPHAVRKAADGSQSKTLVSPWRADHLGFPTRFIVGVSPARFNREVATGADPETVAAMLIVEALATPPVAEHGTRAKRRSAEAA